MNLTFSQTRSGKLSTRDTPKVNWGSSPQFFQKIFLGHRSLVTRHRSPVTRRAKKIFFPLLAQSGVGVPSLQLGAKRLETYGGTDTSSTPTVARPSHRGEPEKKFFRTIFLFFFYFLKNKKK
jgi:hypothetical protein